MRLDRDDHSDVDSDISKPHRPRRVEVLSGPERRRKWPDARKIAIVAETLEPGIVVSDVARRHDLSPSQLFGWLKQFRNEAQALLDAKCPPERPVGDRLEAEFGARVSIKYGWNIMDLGYRAEASAAVQCE